MEKRVRGRAGESDTTDQRRSLTDAELRQVLVDWNTAAPAAPVGARGIQALVERHAVEQPEAPAVCLGDQTLDYRQLDRRANRLSRFLAREGVGPEVRVGLCMERSLEAVISIFGILKAGGAYVPLDPAYPRDRLAYMVEDSGAAVILSQSNLAARLPATDGRRFFYDACLSEIARESPRSLGIRIDPEQAAYVIYTSGSTGRPKGVLVPHRGLFNMAAVQDDLFAAGPGSRILQFASLSFDISVFEILWALTSGAALHLVPREAAVPGPELRSLLQRREITHIDLTPTALNALGALCARYPALREVISGGEACPAELVEHWAPGRRFTNAYGPTEATITASMDPCRAGGGKPTIGRPIRGYAMYVVDRDLRPVAPGATGELLIGGAGLARGYLARPALTAERFVPDWSSESEPGRRLYRTGDLARHLSNGRVDFLGRLDDQVKVRGYRIELGEIEAAIAEHPAVREAAVAVREDQPGARRLVAYAVPTSESTAGGLLDELRRTLRSRLPDYMVPDAFVLLDAMPLSPTGKLDRKALPRPESIKLEDAELVAPRQGVEQALAEMWCELLGVEQVSAADDLFALGGHSLQMVQIIARVRQQWNVELSVRDIFEHPTVTGLARKIEASSGSVAATPKIVVEPRQGPAPLTYPQERVWFLDRLSPGNVAYNTQTSIRFAGPLDFHAMQRALTEVARRHEILRTSFPEVDGLPVQRVHPPLLIALPTVDLRGLDPARREEVAEDLVRAEVRRAFDLDRAPLARWSLMRLDDQDHLFLQTEHHFVHDGWALAVLLREIKVLYGAFRDGLRSPLAPPSLQYSDFAIWHRKWLDGGVMAEQLAYWREQLAGSPRLLELPTDRPRPKVQSFRGDVLRVSFPAQLYGALRQLDRQQGVTLFITMAAAFYTLLHRTTGQRDILAGSGVANRRFRETENMLGMVVNTVVLRTRLEPEMRFEQLLRAVQETVLESHNYQDMPFDKIVEELQPERDLSHNPLFQVMFSFHDSAIPDVDFSGLEGRMFELPNGSAKNDLNVIVIPRSEQRIGQDSDRSAREMTLLWEYSTALFDRSTMVRMLGRYRTLLEAVTRDPSVRLAELPLLGDAERHQLLVEWNDTEVAAPEVAVHELFASWARRSPEALAATGFEAGSTCRLGYGELDRRAEVLGRHLRSLGVGPEVPVAILLHRAPRLLVAILATLKAGGCYLPLDPEAPRQRLAFLLEDSGAAVLLTEESLRPALPESRARVLALDGEPPEPGDPSSEPLPTARGAQRAYVIYTSGSSGQPKGVEISHAGLANLAAWHRRAYHLSPEDRATQVAGLAFDASVWEVWPYLTAGASLHFPRAEVRAEPEKLVRWLVDQKISHSFLPTPMAEAVLREGLLSEGLLSEGLLSEDRPRDLRLRTILTGGDKLHAPPPPGFPTVLVNHYGPTENTVVTTAGVVAPAASGDGAPDIGRPIDRVRVHILDRFARLVPIGVAGELCIGGAGLARGYLGRPALTAESFVPDPLATGGRLYRTGDLVRKLSDGRIEFLGRIDSQVKVRGFRIELGEIEAVLGACPAVREGAVLAWPDASGDNRLVAYVVPTEAENPEALRAKIEEHLATKLPEYMIPSFYVVLEALPLTANDKVDRRALPPPEEDHERVARFVAPRTPEEDVVAAVWCEVLDRRRVSVEDDFFALGGHSLLATRVMARLRRAFSIELPLQVLFEDRTVAALASSIAGLTQRRGAAVPALVPAAERTNLPLSFGQERLWFLDRLYPGSVVYSIPATLRLEGPLDAGALERSLKEIVRRHEILRTTYHPSADGPIQVVHTAALEDLETVDLETSADPPAKLDRLVHEEARKPFDLERGPVFRCRLLRLGEGEHVLLLSLHHIAADGWSAEILMDELAALYQAAVTGGPSPLADLPSQYADFAVWQRRWLEDGALAEQIAYWRERLEGVEPLELATDRPRTAVLGTRGGRESFALSSELSARVRELGRQRGATLYMVLLAAFQALLHRYTGQRDLTVASPIANRGRTEIEGLIGFFINILVLRCDLSALGSGDPSFDQVLRATTSCALEAYAHQDVPFEKLVEELQPERRRDRNPFAAVSFVLQNAGALEYRLDSGLTMHFQPVATGTAKFDLTLSLTDDEPLHGGVEYRLDLFDRSTIRRLIDHYRTILEAAVADPGRGIGELPLLTRAEREQLAAWNRTETSYPGDSSIQELFKAQVARSPGTVALTCGDRRLTYAELDRWAEREARRLLRHGVGPEVLVGLFMGRSVEMVVATLAILKAGGAYLPLAANDPEERLRLVLGDTRAPVLITDAALRPRLPIDDGSSGPTILELEADDPAAERATDGLLPRSHPDQLAYVMYTSGSTGRPKGVSALHRSVIRLVRDTNYGRFGPGDVFLQYAPASFDAATFEIWGALLNGGRVAIMPDGQASLADLGRVVREQQVNIAFFTTALFHQLVESELGALSSLRLLLMGGETVAPADARRTLEKLPETTLIHCYGPTENTTFTTYDPITEPGQIDHILPIGRPISNTTVRVLDRRLRPVPVGVPGELTTGGDGLARGYLQRPALTAERFVPDSTSPGARLYRTGDLARYRSDGRLEFLGRNDHQVKIRGFRIEPGEIEAALADHPKVRDCVVLAREESLGDKMLVAYLVTAGAVETEDLGAFLRRSLPGYMVPAIFDSLEALPLTGSGKVDRAALERRPLPDRAAGELAPPRTALEKLAALVWSEVLGVTVGLENDFFQLGGHSLRATRVVARLQELLDTEVPLHTVFDAPRLEDFAALVDQELGRSEAGKRAQARLARFADRDLPVDQMVLRLQAAEPRMEIARRDPSRPARLSFGQERLWFLDRLEPGSTVYSIPATLRFTGPLDVEALSFGLREIVRRHEVLRSTYRTQAGESVQVIHAAAFPDLEVVDLEDREAGAELRLLDEETRRPFDLESGPVLRCRLLRLADREHVLVMNLHHIATDGWSMEVLIKELAALYQAAADGRPSPLAELPIQYADFAAWQRRRFADELADQVAYWRQNLADLAPLELATDRPRPPVLGTRGARRAFTLTAELSRRVRELARRRGATLYMVLLAAFQALLHRYTGQGDVAVGTPIANRGRTELEGLIGFFINTLVMRADFAADRSFEDHLSAVAETALAAYAHQDVPFEKLVEEIQPERRRDRNPLAEVSFVLQNAAVLERQLGSDLAMRFQMVHTGTSKFDLTLSLTDEEPLHGGVEYNSDLFDPGTIERLIGHYTTLLEAAVSDPGCRLSRLPILESAEIEQLAAWNRTGTDYPRDASIQELFESQAASSPAAVALVCGGRHLSYAELGRQAGRLARRLRRLGIGPETLVGLCLERSLEMVVATLAILEAGGAYVPLDPDFPEDRLRFLLADTAAPVVITRGALRSRLPIGDVAGEPRVIDLDTALEATSDDAEAPLPRSAADQLAYVMYTSGSTGRPKGVAVTHRGVVRLVRDAGYARFGPEDVFLQFAPASFDAATFEIWGALLNGGRLVIVPAGRASLTELRRVVREREVSVAFLTTALFHQLVDGDLVALRGLRLLLTGGETVAPADARKALEGLPETTLIHCYGPTENTSFTTCDPMTDAGQVDHILPIGRPISNTTVRVLDRRLRPVPVGVPGELTTGGDGLARGYLHRPGLTAERFVPDPTSSPGARLYRTGDLARYRSDSRLEFLGRNDHQVKIRGFRIELGEIEAVLGAHPQVRHCVLAVWGEGTDRRLAAYVVADGTEPPEGRELRQLLGKSLPDFMVPSTFTFLDSLPLTRTGKLDRRALPEPSAPRAGSEHVAPRTETEEQLAAIWRRWLKVSRVGVKDNFFELGGHSLLATQVIGDVFETLGVEVPLREIFDRPTVEGLAIAVAAHEAEQIDAGAMEALLDDLEGLADDELESLLAQEDPGS